MADEWTRFFKIILETQMSSLPIPMPFWRDHIEGYFNNYTKVVIIFNEKVYKVDVIHGNGKRLLQNGGARQFVIDSGILVGSSCMFTHVGPLNPDKVTEFRVRIC
ncbi:transcriptional factor B3 family protein [Striga asiatica]|uniref:Transcriptional factor B3 family protein n=1 Tax=Striga asiatica TaxID=4170 RepID=A0A5A7PIK5_STRAF|nr:transcriptional factor B3 family protein [Striga asiatica]